MDLAADSLDFLEGTTDGTVEWKMLNMNSELVASNLISTIGPGNYRVLSQYWPYNPKRGDGTVPINHILRFQTFGQHCSLRTNLRQDYRFRLVTDRAQDGRLQRAHLVMTCDLFNRDDDAQPRVGHAEFWMALTRPFAPPGERTPELIPDDIGFLREHTVQPEDLLARSIDEYRLPSDNRLISGTRPLVFHIDRSDIYRHVNTVVYMDQALDYLALLFCQHGGDAGRLRFRDLTIYFRKPFVPGQVADVELELTDGGDQFTGAVRFYHNDNGRRSERISMAMLASGPLA